MLLKNYAKNFKYNIPININGNIARKRSSCLFIKVIFLYTTNEETKTQRSLL